MLDLTEYGECELFLAISNDEELCGAFSLCDDRDQVRELISCLTYSDEQFEFLIDGEFQ